MARLLAQFVERKRRFNHDLLIMATLKDDSSSWKASGIIRRDFRHTKGDPEVSSHGAKKKNTKRWCKGIEGREHIALHMKHPKYPNLSHGDFCERCGKELKTYWRTTWVANKKTRCNVCGSIIQ